MSIVRTAALSWGQPIHYRSLTIDHTKCGTVDSSNFTVYVSITENFLKSQSNGGYVKYASGTDIVFTSDSAGTTLLKWEIDFYDPVAGVLNAWVLITLVSHTVDTLFYMNVGNVLYTTFQGGATGAAWKSSWQAVYHFANGTTLALTDSTTNAQTLSNNIPACVATTGQLDGGVGCGSVFSGSFLSRNTPVLPSGNAARSMGCWFKMTGGSATIESFMGYGGSNFGLSGTCFNLRYSITYIAIFAGGALQNRSAFTGDALWHHLYVTMPNGDDLTNSIIYVDGVALASSFLINGALNTTLTTMDVGADSTSSFANFSGILDEARYNNGVLSPSWILTMFNNESNFATFCTLGAWHT